MESKAKAVGAIKPTAQNFIEKYQALCKETGFQIVTSPVWKLRDDGSYSMILSHTVEEMPSDR